MREGGGLHAAAHLSAIVLCLVCTHLLFIYYYYNPLHVAVYQTHTHITTPGDALLNVRKAKLIPSYELAVKVGWQGSTADGAAASGVLELPYVADENHDEDPEIRCVCARVKDTLAHLLGRPRAHPARLARRHAQQQPRVHGSSVCALCVEGVCSVCVCAVGQGLRF